MGSDPAGWLDIDPENGIITAAQPLDRESAHAFNGTYKAIILAVDNGEGGQLLPPCPPPCPPCGLQAPPWVPR